MPDLGLEHIEQLIRIEADVHYGVAPPPGRPPFILLDRKSPVLLSAPHGCRTFRNSRSETWHEEDEYTAGMALLLSELCGVSAIVTIWRTDDSDPNYTYEPESPYKRAVRKLAERSGAERSGPNGLRVVIDLHGAGEDTPRMAPSQCVDLGLSLDGGSLPPADEQAVREAIARRLGPEAAERHGFPGWPAEVPGRTITAFAWGGLGLRAVQVEMKPSVRIPWRRADATLYGRVGPYRARPQDVLAMLQALADIIDYFKQGDAP